MKLYKALAAFRSLTTFIISIVTVSLMWIYKGREAYYCA
uniref:Uncharacterized protein n=1 Tax=Anguilla anguilla TaxID=7936 RepID=A0A0E9TLM2_ANGAN